REHQLPSQTLAHGMLAHQPLELGHEVDVPAPLEILFDAALEAADPPPPEPRDLGLREALIREVRERRPAPERERLVELALLLQALEAREVELVGLHAQHVSRRPRLDAILPEHLAELGHVDLQRLRRGLGRIALPDRVDQPVLRDDAVRLEEEHREQGPLLRPAEIEHLSGGRGLERAQDAEFHCVASDDASTGPKRPQAAALAPLYPALVPPLPAECRVGREIADGDRTKEER